MSRRNPISRALEHLSSRVTQWAGSSSAFALALLVIFAWLVTGPMFQYSNTWQLVINTGTTIVTFLMVFVIQATQKRDAKAVHLKLDELIRVSRARNVFADLEDADEGEIESFAREFKRLRKTGSTPEHAATRAHEIVHKTKH